MELDFEPRLSDFRTSHSYHFTVHIAVYSCIKLVSKHLLSYLYVLDIVMNPKETEPKGGKKYRPLVHIYFSLFMFPQKGGLPTPLPRKEIQEEPVQLPSVLYSLLGVP